MANIRKSFNFRNGVQVDNDKFVVNPNGLVGIGTTVPTEVLDVRGTAKVTGILTATELHSGTGAVLAGVTTVSTLTDGSLQISSGIITAVTGVVTFFGDGAGLINIPTSQWIDIDVGLGFTSIYAEGNVGVHTNDPRFSFQIGGQPGLEGHEGVGISSITGDIISTGIISATTLTGAFDATQLTGTIDNDRLPTNIDKPTGIITAANFVGILTGNVTGTASTAQSLTGSPNITVTDISAGIITATRLDVTDIDTTRLDVSGVSTIGTLEVTNTIDVGTSKFVVVNDGDVGIGTTNPITGITLRRDASNATLEILAPNNRPQISIGQSSLFGNDSALIRHKDDKLEIFNYDVGSIDTYIHEGTGTGSTGNFRWIYGQSNNTLMALTYEGNLGINDSSPDHRLSVSGISTFTGNAYFNSDVTIEGTLNATINLPSVIESNINASSGVSTIVDGRVTTNLIVENAVGVGSTNVKINVPGLDCSTALGVFNAVGVGTTSPDSAVDFGNAGSGTDNFMVLPRVSNTARVGLLTDTTAGALIYNTDLNKLQFYTGTDWETVTSS